MPKSRVNRHSYRASAQHDGMVKPTRKGAGAAGKAHGAPIPAQAPATHSPAETPGAPAAPDKTTIGGRIAICRRAKGMKPAACARAVSIRQASWSDLESGKSKQPAADTLLEMRDRLGFDPDYIIKGKGMPLLPNFEELAREQALLSIFRELKPENKQTALNLVQGIRRAQGGTSASDPFPFDPPDPHTN